MNDRRKMICVMNECRPKSHKKGALKLVSKKSTRAFAHELVSENHPKSLFRKPAQELGSECLNQKLGLHKSHTNIRFKNREK
jgi:hypothetical protein